MPVKYASPTWLEWCPSCKRQHRMKIRKCTGCFTYETPQPASDWVIENCGHYWPECEGCQAYAEHTCPY